MPTTTPRELTLSLHNPEGYLSVEILTKTLKDVLDMLRSVSSEVVSSNVDVRWEVIRVGMRSPLRMTLAPRIHDGKPALVQRIRKKVVNACMNGIRQIEIENTLPPHFNEESLESLRSMAKRTEAITTWSLNGHDRITLTEKTVELIEQYQSSARSYIDFSTIEGYLEVVSVHDGPSFFIWEVLTGQKIECRGNEREFDRSLQLLKQRPRIAVTGRVQYRNHIPKTIEVDSVAVLPDSKILPQPKDIGPIDLTNGLSSEEHVRRMRNA